MKNSKTVVAKQTIYGTFDGSKMVAFKGCDSLENLGKRMLQRTMREEGFKWNVAGVLEYLESWCDWSQDMEEPCNDPEMMIDQAVDTLVYSNIHWMNVQTNCQITSAEREIVRGEISRILYVPFKK